MQPVSILHVGSALHLQNGTGGLCLLVMMYHLCTLVHGFQVVLCNSNVVQAVPARPVSAPCTACLYTLHLTAPASLRGPCGDCYR